MHGCQDRLIAIDGRATLALNYIHSLRQYARANTLWDDEAAREALALAALELEGIRKILDAPVLAADGTRAPVTSTVPASQ